MCQRIEEQNQSCNSEFSFIGFALRFFPDILKYARGNTQWTFGRRNQRGLCVPHIHCTTTLNEKLRVWWKFIQFYWRQSVWRQYYLLENNWWSARWKWFSGDNKKKITFFSKIHTFKILGFFFCWRYIKKGKRSLSIFKLFCFDNFLLERKKNLLCLTRKRSKEKRKKNTNGLNLCELKEKNKTIGTLWKQNWMFWKKQHQKSAYTQFGH